MPKRESGHQPLASLRNWQARGQRGSRQNSEFHFLLALCFRWQNSVVPAPTERLANRVRRDFPADRADEVIGWLSGLPANAFGGQDPERVQAALVLAAAGQLSRFLAGVDLLRQDWRDVLVSGDLADEDWPVRLDAELP